MFLQQTLLAFVLVAGFATSHDHISQGTKDQWCLMQTTSCGIICSQFDEGDPSKNDCDTETLDFACVCGSGIEPDASEFSQTIPYFLCTDQNTQCVENCDGDSACQSSCRQDNPCGAQDPTRVTLTTSLSTASATASSEAGSESTAIDVGFGGDSADQGNSGAGRLALELGPVYGMGIIVAGFVGGFALLL